MSFNVLKRGVNRLKTITKGDSSTSDLDTSTPNGSTHDIEAVKYKKSIERSRSKADKRQKEHLAKKREEDFLKNGPEEVIALYKPLSMNMSKKWTHEERFDFKNFDQEGKIIMPLINSQIS